MKDEIVAALRETALDPMHPQQTKAAHLLLTNLYPTEFAKVSHVVQHKQETAEAYDLGVLRQDELRELRRLLVKVKAARDKPVLELKE